MKVIKKNQNKKKLPNYFFAISPLNYIYIQECFTLIFLWNIFYFIWLWNICRASLVWLVWTKWQQLSYTLLKINVLWTKVAGQHLLRLSNGSSVWCNRLNNNNNNKKKNVHIKWQGQFLKRKYKQYNVFFLTSCRHAGCK